MSIALYFYIFIRLLQVVTIYYISNTAHVKSRIHKTIISIFALSFTLAASYGIAHLDMTFAKGSSLLSKP